MIKTVKKYLIPHQDNNHTPHIFHEKSLAVLFTLAFLLFCTSLGSSYILKKTDFGATVLPAVLVDLTNEHRLENNQKVLAVNSTLEKAALMKAKDMEEKGYFAHTSPEGITPWYWFSKAGYRFVYAGENLAINFAESSDVEKAWIASPTHHANLISEKFDEIGIATYDANYQGRSTTFVVQLFGRRPQAKSEVLVPEVKTPVSTKPVSKVVVLPEVKGASATALQAPVDPSEPAPVLILNDKNFSVAQNINENDSSVDQKTDTFVRQADFVDRFLVSQPKNVQNIYLVLILIIYVVFISMIVMQLRYKHSIKHIAFAVLLLCTLGALAYLNSDFVLSFL